MLDLLQTWLVNHGVGQNYVFYVSRGIATAGMLIVSFGANIFAKKYILRGLTYLVSKTKTTWDDALLRQNVLKHLSHLVPAIIVYISTPIVLDGMPTTILFIRSACQIYMIIVLMLALDAVLSTIDAYLQESRSSKEIALNGFIQALKIALYFLTLVFVISILLNQSPMYLLSGIGALSAVLMLIFRDAILGFVAGIQLAANKMVATGDWIEMPNYGADGDVLDVGLTTVKVQNWDKTVTTIPTYALISESFKNWRGMSESGGRRIKRSVNIDVNSIKFCDEEMLERFAKIQYISEYIESKKQELDEFNKASGANSASLANGRRMTNIGTFRAYVVAYLKDHPKINQKMTFLVRQLQSTEYGLPIEIYVFSSDQIWANYEGIQSDIFDHVLAVLPEFDLRICQNPTGSDFRFLNPQSAENSKTV